MTSGPLPKASNAKRRPNATPAHGFKHLPAEGRSGPTPSWPLTTFASDDEDAMWIRLWKLPQAIEWERMHCEDIVALYVRAFVRASDADNYKLLAEVRQLDSKIGISPRAMMDLRWETDEQPEVEVEEDVPSANGHAPFVPSATPS